MTTSNNISYDSRKYKCCAPYYGKKGPEFTRRFRPEFIGALHSFPDKFATLYDHITGADPGGTPPGAAGPNAHPGNPGTNIHTESTMALTSRSKALYSLIWTHVEDPDIRLELSTVPGDGLAAWGIVERHGNLPTTGLTTVNQDIAWTTLKLTDVGVT